VKRHSGLRMTFLTVALLTARFVAIADKHRLPASEVLAWSPAQQDDAATHYHLSDTLREKGDLDGAIAEYRTAISQQPNFPEAHANLGVALKAKGDMDGAIAEWGTAIRQRPNYPEVQSALDKAHA